MKYKINRFNLSDNNFTYDITNSKSNEIFLETQYLSALKFKKELFNNNLYINIPVIIGSFKEYEIQNKKYVGYKTKLIKTTYKDSNYYNLIPNIIDIFKNSHVENKEQQDFSLYLDYIISISIELFNKKSSNFFQNIINYLSIYGEQYLPYFSNNSSLCHGDLTEENVIYDGNKIYLINTNTRTDMWQSYLLDASKFIQNATINDLSILTENPNKLNFLLLTHCLQSMYNMVENSNEYNKNLLCINEILKLTNKNN